MVVARREAWGGRRVGHCTTEPCGVRLPAPARSAVASQDLTLHGPGQYATLALLEQKLEAAIRGKLLAMQEGLRTAQPVHALHYLFPAAAGWLRLLTEVSCLSARTHCV
jgi:hypothetical protein